MIPSVNNLLLTEINEEDMPSKNYQMISESVRGTVDTIEAMKQVVYKILCTERYVYPIYSWNYGIELVDLFGESVTYACPEITRRIEEALLQDERINSVDQFEFDTSKKHEVVCTFSVHTIFGDFQMEKEVSI